MRRTPRPAPTPWGVSVLWRQKLGICLLVGLETVTLDLTTDSYT